MILASDVILRALQEPQPLRPLYLSRDFANFSVRDGLLSVAQVGTDRIIEIQFSEGQYRLFLEFYAGGNIVLVDQDLFVLALFRTVGKEADQEELRVGLKCSLTNRQNYNGIPALAEERST